MSKFTKFTGADEKLRQGVVLETPDVVNSESHSAYSEGIYQEVARVALTGVIKDNYYSKAEDQMGEFIPVCAKMAKKDPDFLMKAAVVSRKANFKLFPKVAIGTLIANSETFKPAFRPKMVQILSTFNAGQLLELVVLIKAGTFGKKLGSKEQKLFAAVIQGWDLKKLEAQTIAEGTDLYNLVRLVHPKLPELVRYVTADTAIGDAQKAMENFKETKDRALISKYRLPFNALKGFVKNEEKGLWEEIAGQMSSMQLLINLRSLTEKGVMDSAFLRKQLGNVDVDKVRLTPIDVVRPLVHASPEYHGVLCDFMDKMCHIQMPGLRDEEVAVFLDHSGSMQGYNWVLGCALTASVLYSAPKADFFHFGNSVTPKRRPSGEYFNSMFRDNPNEGTDTEKVAQHLLASDKKYKVVYLITDEQQNGAGSFYNTWMRYYKSRNQQVHCVVLNCTEQRFHISPDVEMKNRENGISLVNTVTPLVFKMMEHYKDSPADFISRVTLD